MAFFDRKDLDFQLWDVAGLDQVLAHSDLDHDAVTGILDTAEQIAETQFFPHGRLLDEQEPEFIDGCAVLPDVVKPAVDAHIEAGFLAAPFDPENGGLGFPETVSQAAAFIMSAANVGLGAYAMLTVGSGRLIQSFGSEAQKQKYLHPMVEGRFFGTMCLSEPQAGSSLSDIKTRAELQPDGTYKITGNKMWISGGDHELSENIVHLVLAKIPGGPAGVKGISLFIVPKKREDGTRNDVTLAGLNHKMGFRATTNCALNFGDNGECVGELLGEPHRGLAYMFQMMNEARIGVGMGATALGQAGYQLSLDYARNRPQGRAPTAKDPQTPQVPLTDHADIRRLLLAQKSAVEPSLAIGLYCARLVDDHRAGDDKAMALLDVLTPIAKSWPSEFCLEANKHAIQILGGAGYTRDYAAERLYRDNRLNPIHEGTHGIQGMDLLGRKVLMDGGAGLKLLRETIQIDIDAAPTDEFSAPLSQALDELASMTMSLVMQIMADPTKGLSNATLYLDCFGHVVMAWMWLRITNAAAAVQARDGDSDFLNGKLQAARYFYGRELVRVAQWVKTLAANESSAYDMQDAWF